MKLEPAIESPALYCSYDGSLLYWIAVFSAIESPALAICSCSKCPSLQPAPQVRMQLRGQLEPMDCGNCTHTRIKCRAWPRVRLCNFLRSVCYSCSQLGIMKPTVVVVNALPLSIAGKLPPWSQSHRPDYFIGGRILSGDIANILLVPWNVGRVKFGQQCLTACRPES